MDLESLFALVSKQGASDLLVSAGAPPMLRINGKLLRTRDEILTPEATREMIFAILTKEQKDHFEKHKELDFSLAVGRKHRFRVNVYLQKQAVTAAFRPIPEDIPSLDSLGLPPIAREFTLAAQGLILVTGPTGHGKTTTQAAMIDLVNNTRECHVITVEDPIEFIHQHKRSIVDQREIGGDTHSFGAALKYVLRQDPDVILIGEMRDLETIQAALRAAETGHLVLATLHTNDAVQTVDRVIDVFPAEQQQQVRFQLSMTLLAVMSQRLLPRADGNGRILACELLRNNNAVANLIREGKTHQVYSIMETNVKEGMITMDRSVRDLYLNGLISYDDAVGHVRNVKTLMEASPAR
ncbi:MAG TPA: type IV pilus twitching motility protein PilT [Candidatus Hydrogenedentes bacterium]|nr:type IV pilus twitching motility protein PilT [Candidatus Hydrogenedentota bacterium]HOS01515.1 type IV pilus twitching motility protein PilT [Candidatus Hydrogenedentota bacterium]